MSSSNKSSVILFQVNLQSLRIFSKPIRDFHDFNSKVTRMVVEHVAKAISTHRANTIKIKRFGYAHEVMRRKNDAAPWSRRKTSMAI